MYTYKILKNIRINHCQSNTSSQILSYVLSYVSHVTDQAVSFCRAKLITRDDVNINPKTRIYPRFMDPEARKIGLKLG